MPEHEPPSVAPLWIALGVVWLAVPVVGVVIGALTDPLSSQWWYALIGAGLVAGTLVLWRWISLQRPPDA
jgi:hypothetical protein